MLKLTSYKSRPKTQRNAPENRLSAVLILRPRRENSFLIALQFGPGRSGLTQYGCNFAKGECARWWPVDRPKDWRGPFRDAIVCGVVGPRNRSTHGQWEFKLNCCNFRPRGANWGISKIIREAIELAYVVGWLNESWESCINLGVVPTPKPKREVSGDSDFRWWSMILNGLIELKKWSDPQHRTKIAGKMFTKSPHWLRFLLPAVKNPQLIQFSWNRWTNLGGHTLSQDRAITLVSGPKKKKHFQPFCLSDSVQSSQQKPSLIEPQTNWNKAHKRQSTISLSHTQQASNFPIES